MDRRTFAAGLAAGLAAGAVGDRARAAGGIGNVVLVHGAYADGSCWSAVIARLLAAGLRVSAVQQPLTTLEAGVAATRRALALQDGPAVLVGHSFAGAVITQAGTDPKAAALVYVAARAPDAGEDYTALAKTYPAPPASAGLKWSDGYGRLSEAAFLADFANGVAPETARILYAVQAPIADTLFSGKVGEAAWRAKPSWYAVSRRDRTIDPDLQRFMAGRMKARTVEIDAGHLSPVSHPDAVAGLILKAAGRA